MLAQVRPGLQTGPTLGLLPLDRRVRSDHPLRRTRQLVDFGFVRGEVEPLYGYNGNESVPPEVILKLLFLLFFDEIASER